MSLASSGQHVPGTRRHGWVISEHWREKPAGAGQQFPGCDSDTASVRRVTTMVHVLPRSIAMATEITSASSMTRQDRASSRAAGPRSVLGCPLMTRLRSFWCGGGEYG
jgi:hypothetical protein